MGNIRHLLEIYADDLTAFLEPNSLNLRNFITILSNFQKLSGLKINLSKTKAVWFGKEYNSTMKLCPDLKLEWAKDFTLLGIKFDNYLQNMESNFLEKFEKIEKLLSSWSYRYLTPFGKVTIVKSLGLSKISHIALVIPNPSKDMLKRLNSLFFKFIWGNKSEKVNREDSTLPVKFGGLGMPDVLKFWAAFKFSWFRRLITTKSFWPQILLSQVSKILGHDIKATQILELGPSKISQISKKLKNIFWRQVFETAIPVTEGAIFCYPEKFIISSFWHNPLVKRKNKPIKETDFPEIVGKIATLSDLLSPGSNVIMEWNEFCLRYQSNISHEKYIDIRYIFKLSLQKLNLPYTRLNCACYPQKPLLIDMALSTSKGCSMYYKILRKKSILSNKMHVRENKWHNELNCNFSIIFWNNSRKLYSNIEFDNKMKWLQFQIVRNSLQTNYIVNHFKPNVSKKCQYCMDGDELVSHLFWSCHIVHSFLNQISTFLLNSGLEYTPSRAQMLFGFLELHPSHPKNYISLVLKKYIWVTKFKTKKLNLNGFKSLLKTCISDLKYIYEMKNSPERFHEWNTLYNLL